MIVEYSLLLIVILGLIPIRDTKIKVFISILMIGVLACVFAGTNYSVDQYAYSVLYSDSNYYTVEKGYVNLSKLFSVLGLDYIQFKIVVLLIGTLLLFIRAKNVQNVDFRKVVILWLLTGYWFDIEQSRNMIAMIFVLFATKYLEEKSLANIIKYLVFIGIAFSIHTSSIAYVLLLLVYLPDSTVEKKVPLIAVLLMVLCILFATNMSSIGSFVYKFIPNKRVLMWFSFKTNNGWIGPVTVQFAMYFILNYGKKILIQHQQEEAVNDYYSFYQVIYKICCISFLFMPFYLFSTEFIRLIRGLFIIVFVCIFIAYYYASGSQKVILLSMCAVFTVLFNLQGLRGILFYNEYFIENIIMKNDMNTDPKFLLYLIPFVFLGGLVMGNKKYRFCIGRRRL